MIEEANDDCQSAAMSRRQRKPAPSACIRSTSSCWRFPTLMSPQDFYANFGLDMVRNGNTLALKTFGHEHRWGSVVEGKTKALHHLSFGCYAEDLAAAQGAHRRQRRQADRSAARLREQRLLVPQSRKPADRGEGRAQGVARPQSGKPMDVGAGRHRRRRHPAELAAGAAPPAVACPDLQPRRRRLDPILRTQSRPAAVRPLRRSGCLHARHPWQRPSSAWPS